jgi:hypothetical protein
MLKRLFDRDRWRERRERAEALPNRAANCGVVVLLILAAAVSLGNEFVHKSDYGDRECSSGSPVTSGPPQPVELNDVDATHGPAVVVGRSGHATSDGVQLTLAQVSGSAPFRRSTTYSAAVGSLRRSDGRVLAESHVTAVAQSSKNGFEITLRVCVDPVPHGGVDSEAVDVAKPGQYIGAAWVDVPNVTGGHAPVKVDILYPHFEYPLIFGMLSATLALAYTWGIRQIDPNVTGAPISLSRAFFIRGVALAIGLGVASQKAVEDPSWGGDFSDYRTLALLVGAAVIAAVPTLNAVINKAATEPGPSVDESHEKAAR